MSHEHESLLVYDWENDNFSRNKYAAAHQQPLASLPAQNNILDVALMDRW